MGGHTRKVSLQKQVMCALTGLVGIVVLVNFSFEELSLFGHIFREECCCSR